MKGKKNNLILFPKCTIKTTTQCKCDNKVDTHDNWKLFEATTKVVQYMKENISPQKQEYQNSIAWIQDACSWHATAVCTIKQQYKVLKLGPTANELPLYIEITSRLLIWLG